jgi:TIR domain
VSSVFINYRTNDEEGSATLIETELSHRFGSDEIFRASKSIPAGDDFERVIMRAVRRSEVLLAVIGPRWLTATDQCGRRSIDLEDDWTRREILEAFRCEIRVIPVLVGGAQRLSPADLPAELTTLAGRQYVRLNHRNAAPDLASLAAILTSLVPDLKDQTVPARPPAPGMTNNANDDSRVAVQGIVHGDVRFDGNER